MQTSDLFTIVYDFATNYSDGAKTVQVNQGGTSSGKTYSILQVLFLLSAQHERLVTTIVGQDIPNLKAGALRDALNIYHDNPEIKAAIKSYNKTERIFEFLNGSIMEFKSYDSAQDAKSGKRNFLFINEANGIRFDIYSELSMRTRKTNGIGGKTIIDYNPNAGFWAHEFVIGQSWVDLVISDHRINPFLTDEDREKIERIRFRDVELWKVYARGLTGRVEGLIFNNWYIVDDIPKDAKFIANGLDWGFTNDETGVIEVWMQDGELWVHELIYETGLTNPDISAKLKFCGVKKTEEIIADSSEPKSIEEMRRMGWYIMPAAKGPDSVKASIDILKRYKINITRASVNLRKELGRYTWKTDKTGAKLNEPVDLFNHLIDPLRYIALNKLKIRNLAKPGSRLPYKPIAKTGGDYEGLM